MLWFVVVALALAALWFWLGADRQKGSNEQEVDQGNDWQPLHLDAIHRRFVVARFKYEVRRDAAAARRALREDLRRLPDRKRW